MPITKEQRSAAAKKGWQTRRNKKSAKPAPFSIHPEGNTFTNPRGYRRFALEIARYHPDPLTRERGKKIAQRAKRIEKRGDALFGELNNLLNRPQAPAIRRRIKSLQQQIRDLHEGRL